MNRRDFLKLVFILGGAVTVSRCKPLKKGDEAMFVIGAGEEKSIVAGQGDGTIIVIGAGVAGLSAAHSLQMQGYNVIVLEARSRLGGRVHTSREWPDVPLDLGASWIHGISRNPIALLAKNNDIKTVKTDYDNYWVYNTDGSDLVDAAYDPLEKHFTLFESYLRKANKDLDQDVSLQFVLDTLLTEENISAAEKKKILYLLNSIIEQDYAADLDELSLFAFDSGEEFGGPDVIFPDGYDQIVNILANGLEIRINEIVQRVEYSDAGVTITTEHGTYKGGHAIITLPLGVLQAGSVQFSPPLPEKKQNAIRDLRMGLLDKLYLRFPHVFWPKEAEILGYISEIKGEWAEWVNMAYYIDTPILEGTNVATFARETETWSDQQIVDSAMKTLRTMFGSNIPDPLSWQITRWAADPFSMGSYSYNPPGTNGKTMDALAAPVASRLFFAGEATSRNYNATVHGAYLSGIRAVKEFTESILDG